MNRLKKLARIVVRAPLDMLSLPIGGYGEDNEAEFRKLRFEAVRGTWITVFVFFLIGGGAIFAPRFIDSIFLLKRAVVGKGQLAPNGPFKSDCGVAYEFEGRKYLVKDSRGWRDCPYGLETEVYIDPRNPSTASDSSPWDDFIGGVLFIVFGLGVFPLLAAAWAYYRAGKRPFEL